MTTIIDKPSPVPRAKADEAEPPATADPERIVAEPSRRLPVILLVLATVAVLALGVTFGLRVVDNGERDELRTSAVRAAEDHALALLSISSDNVDDRLNEMLTNSTGDFRRQFEGIRKTFGEVVKKGKVTSRGEIVSSAVSEVDDASARVLLALSAQVTNSEAKKPEGRQYRITVDLTRKEEQWLISGMQFVP